MIDRNLRSLNGELLRRQKLFAATGLENIHKYQEAYRSGRVSEPLPYLLLIVDEFADDSDGFVDEWNDLLVVSVGGAMLCLPHQDFEEFLADFVVPGVAFLAEPLKIFFVEVVVAHCRWSPIRMTHYNGIGFFFKRPSTAPPRCRQFLPIYSIANVSTNTSPTLSPGLWSETKKPLQKLPTNSSTLLTGLRLNTYFRNTVRLKTVLSDQLQIVFRRDT